MRAALCNNFEKGAPLDIVEMQPIETVKPDEIRIDVKVAGLNFFDTLIVRNRYQYKPDLPFSPSAECSGIITEAGPAVDHVSVGDRVAGYMTFGCARTEVVVPANNFTKIPDNVTFETAAAVPVTYGTGLHGLKDRGLLAQGETLAVTGASGGAGLAAVELGKIMGANIIALASSDEKLTICKANGAEHLINYSTDDVRGRLKEITNGKGVDVIYDCVGGEGAETLVRALAWNGRFLVIGFAAGQIQKIPANLLLLKGASAVGVFWGSFVERTPMANRANLDQILAWCASTELVPHIHGVFPLEEINDAMALISNRKVKGKILLAME